MELGGKSPQIVFPDADLARAADFTVKAILQNAGQTCSAGSRLLVHDSIHDVLVDMVRQRLLQATMGPGVEDKDIGPLISRKQQHRVQSMLAENVKGEILCGGRAPEGQGLAKGSYFLPTLVDDVDPRALLLAALWAAIG